LTFNNRRIVQLHGSVRGRTPADRAEAASRVLGEIVRGRGSLDVTLTPVASAMLVTVGGRDVFVILPDDVDTLANTDLTRTANEAAANLRVALAEAAEVYQVGSMAMAITVAATGTIVYFAILFVMVRFHRRLAANAEASAERRLQKISATDLDSVRDSRAAQIVRHAVMAITVIAAAVLTYVWLTFTLRRFPFTRALGESLREILINLVINGALAVARAMPDLLMVALIAVVTRVLVRLSNLLFQAAEAGRVELPYIYPETAAPSRRLVAALLWLGALIVAYPYLPGSDSDVFKGVSVFLGLIVSIGSSGIANQIMSGFTITYSRAVRTGDFVKIGDIEGTVLQVGALSTKVRTLLQEEVTIPNAVVVGQVTTNYSRFADKDGLYIPTTVTIGYDTPWRQVEALLLLAAERTPGIRRQPPPIVRQTALMDFYVQYRLLVSIENPALRVVTLDRLHANIQDAFNEHGVQIMSPNYEADPEGKKIVSRDNWFAPPAPTDRPGP
ncbi:MAG TPA: mechanosensitive ion channel domain-containing protein, partial [Vicinamibacterales bacterium]|nr:mechanosensitive ion channel domain-containing protein [Vicinamibacterales bacterium]